MPSARARCTLRFAGRTGQVLDLSKASDGLAVDRTTIEQYVRLLEDLFLAQRLPAWGKALRARASATPKVHIADSGLAARLLGVSEAKLATLDPTTQSEFGHLLGTFVVGEWRKQASWLDERVTSSRGCGNSARRWARDSSQGSRSAREPGPTPTRTGSTFYRSTDSGDRWRPHSRWRNQAETSLEPGLETQSRERSDRPNTLLRPSERYVHQG